MEGQENDREKSHGEKSKCGKSDWQVCAVENRRCSV